MLTTSSTTLDWQLHTARVCVLPIGSFEQHGHHLPLSTDVICADYFGGVLAEHLGAVLLPTQPYGTCHEHSGFRGSMSLRPETLMQIVRDLAAELEQQAFEIMVLLNGHGGNFALGPVVRDINRLDGKLKIVLADWWNYYDPALASESARLGVEIHAGEMETSVMMALFPDLVRTDSADIGSDGNGLLQRDLNTFGTGHFAPIGAIGFPSFATAEKGHAVVAQIAQRMTAAVDERIARLRRQPRYAGTGGIAIRLMNEDDVPAGMRLKEASGWNQTAADWHLLLQSGPHLCFVAVHNGLVVGSATAIAYSNALAWIGMVLVDPASRRMGIGRLLMEHLLRRLQGFELVGLDATPVGKELYLKLGFTDQCSLQRLTHAVAPLIDDRHDGVQPLQPDDWPELLKLDQRSFGLDRQPLLRALHAADGRRGFCFKADGQLAGFALARPGANYHQIGPVVAPSDDAAKALIAAAMATLTGRPVLLDVPDWQPAIQNWLIGKGFVSQRPFLRMTLSGKPLPGDAATVFACAGPELG